MRLLPDADALEFAASIRALLAEACDSAVLRAAWEGDTGRVPGLWKRLAEAGVLGLTVPTDHGGSGADLTTAVAVLVETGRAAIPEPVVETLAGAALLAAAGGPVADEWLPRIAAGDAVVCLGEGADQPVMSAPWADLFLLGSADGVRAVPRDAVDVVPVRMLDRGVRVGTVRWDPAAEALLPECDAVIAFDTACVAVAAQLVGLAQAMLDMAVRYAGVREQFGQPIGRFQAVKHQLADAFVDIAFAAPVVHRAAWSVAHDVPARSRDASHAKYAAGRAAEHAARTALQVHAGIGYTYEHDLHMWMKRTWTLASQWGDAGFHRSRVGQAVLVEERPPRVP